MRYSITLLALLLCTRASAQTVVITDTTAPKWIPSTDNGTLFGTPPQPLLTKYVAELFLASKVDKNGTPIGTPILTLDFGKPPVVGNLQIGPALKPLLQAGTEYILFLNAQGPGGVSDRTPASVPFVVPTVPRAVPSAVSFTP